MAPSKIYTCKRLVKKSFRLREALFWQRFWIDVTYFNGSGPVFLIVSGTQEATTSMITDSQIANTASIYNAMIVLVEHRYFGDSIPTELETVSRIFCFSFSILLVSIYLNLKRPVARQLGVSDR